MTKYEKAHLQALTEAVVFLLGIAKIDDPGLHMVRNSMSSKLWASWELTGSQLDNSSP